METSRERWDAMRTFAGDGLADLVRELLETDLLPDEMAEEAAELLARWTIAVNAR